MDLIISDITQDELRALFISLGFRFSYLDGLFWSEHPNPNQITGLELDRERMALKSLFEKLGLD